MRLPMLAMAMIMGLAVSCSDDEAAANAAPVPNVYQVLDLISAPDYKLLKAAIQKAGLVETVSNTPNITLFAPDDIAFGNSGITSIDGLTSAQLRTILLYHVVPARVPSTAVPVSDSVNTVNTENIYASRNANGVFVNGVRVKRADVLGSNGVIHTIDRVLMPPSRTILAFTIEDTTLQFLGRAINRLGLGVTFGSPGKFTVFGPTNAAFRAAGITNVDAVPLPLLDNVIKFHVVGTNIFASDLINGATAPTLQGGTVTVQATPAPTVRISTSAQPAASITNPNIVATNGVIHKINRVMLP